MLFHRSENLKSLFIYLISDQRPFILTKGVLFNYQVSKANICNSCSSLGGDDSFF